MNTEDTTTDTTMPTYFDCGHNDHHTRGTATTDAVAIVLAYRYPSLVFNSHESPACFEAQGPRTYLRVNDHDVFVETDTFLESFEAHCGEYVWSDNLAATTDAETE